MKCIVRLTPVLQICEAPIAIQDIRALRAFHFHLYFHIMTSIHSYFIAYSRPNGWFMQSCATQEAGWDFMREAHCCCPGQRLNDAGVRMVQFILSFINNRAGATVIRWHCLCRNLPQDRVLHIELALYEVSNYFVIPDYCFLTL
jgi:hypothetical protein